MGPKMAQIRKIPDTWTLETYAIVLKDSRQAEHEEIGCTNTTRWAQFTRTSTLVGEELKNTKKRTKQIHNKTKLSVLEYQRWWESSSKVKSIQRKGRSNVGTIMATWRYLWIPSEIRKEMIS